ncbi:5-deoxy-glucuronate isomerase, partial [Streptomyces sp. TRM76130]|nr:5-deoxy-glucuronate isomerase [Streptomyces sp. TRM76130]
MSSLPAPEPAVRHPDTATHHLPAGSAADGPYDLVVTPDSAGWGFSGLRVLTLAPGASHPLATGDAEFLVLPLAGSCTVAVDGEVFELAGRTG